MSGLLNRNKITLLVCNMAGTTINESGIVYKSLYDTLAKLGLGEKGWKKRWEVGGRQGCCDESDNSKSHSDIIRKHINEYFEPYPENISKFEYINKYKKLYREVEIDTLNELRSQYFNVNTDNPVSLIDPDLLDLFSHLRFNGVKVALNTGYSQDFQQEIISHFKLKNHIDNYISSEEVSVGKPYPYMIHTLMERTQIRDVKNVAKIGDTKDDMLEGKNAGCGLTIGVLTGSTSETELRNYGADIVLKSIMDLNNTDMFHNCPFLL